MKYGTNVVVLAGNLCRDVEIKNVGQKHTPVATISLAINDRIKKSDGWADETTFVDVTVWGAMAENAANWLGKGSSVIVEGRLKLDTWEQDGQKRSKLKVVAVNVRSCEVKKPENSGVDQTSRYDDVDQSGGDEFQF